jgi:hypothetical protein
VNADGFFYLNAWKRLIKTFMDGNRITPSVNCARARDKFTVSRAKGNGALTYPVGLMTADEIVLAGATPYHQVFDDYKDTDGIYASGNRTQYNYLYVLNYQNTIWTMTPIGGNQYHARWGAMNGGWFFAFRSINSGEIRPVVSLMPLIEISGGNGSEETPYVIE